jgi:hypothetical protein
MKKGGKLLFFLALVLVGGLLFSSVPALAGENPGRGKSLAEARKVLEQQLVGAPGFVGIAHSEQRAEITVFVDNEQARGIAPQCFEGYPVRVEVTGRFQALATQVTEPVSPSQATTVSRLGEVRPLVGGISLSAYVEGQKWAGTLGMLTHDGKILSNAHVIAMDLAGNFLPAGTPIIQPGSHPYDGGTLENQVGTLEHYIPIQFGQQVGRSPTMRYPANYADAAIAVIGDDVEASPGEQFDEAGNYAVSGTTTVVAGDWVRKSGRTTGVTEAEVYVTNLSVLVEYAPGKVAYFVDQIAVHQPFIESGDSGSLVDKDGNAVGLVFAGSDLYGIVCKIEYVIEGLGIAVEPIDPVEPPPPGDTPEVNSVDPNSASRRDRLTVTISGANFQNGAAVDFGERVIVQEVTFVSASQLKVQIRIHNLAASGPRDVTVTNPDGQNDTLFGGFTVLQQ